MAELGVGILIIPQKPWTEVARELEAYREVYRQVNGADAPPPISAGLDLLRLERRAGAGDGPPVHRRLLSDACSTTTSSRAITSPHQGLRVLRQDGGEDHEYGTDKVVDFFMDLQVWGTPEQCYEKILDIRRRTGNSHYVGVFG